MALGVRGGSTCKEYLDVTSFIFFIYLKLIKKRFAFMLTSLIQH